MFSMESNHNNRPAPIWQGLCESTRKGTKNHEKPLDLGPGSSMETIRLR